MNIKRRLSKVEEVLKLLNNQDLKGKVFIIWETDKPGIYSLTEGNTQLCKGTQKEVQNYIKSYEESKVFTIWINTVQEYAM